jgi:hypothetical protein
VCQRRCESEHGGGGVRSIIIAGHGELVVFVVVVVDVEGCDERNEVGRAGEK